MLAMSGAAVEGLAKRLGGVRIWEQWWYVRQEPEWHISGDYLTIAGVRLHVEEFKHEGTKIELSGLGFNVCIIPDLRLEAPKITITNPVALYMSAPV